MAKKEKTEKSQKGFYKIQDIVDCRKGSSGDKEYLVKWKNYPSSQNTWQPLHNLQTAQLLIQIFQNRRQQPTLHHYFTKIRQTSTKEKPQQGVQQQCNKLVVQQNVLEKNLSISLDISNDNVNLQKIEQVQNNAMDQLGNEMSFLADKIEEQVKDDSEQQSLQEQQGKKDIFYRIKQDKKRGRKRDKKLEQPSCKLQKLINSTTQIEQINNGQEHNSNETTQNKRCLSKMVDSTLIIYDPKQTRRQNLISRRLQMQKKRNLTTEIEQQSMLPSIQEQLQQYMEQNPKQLFLSSKGLSVQLRDQNDKKICLSVKQISMVNARWIKDLFQSFI